MATNPVLSEALAAGVAGSTWGTAQTSYYTATAADAGKQIWFGIDGGTNANVVQQIQLDVIAIPEPSRALLLLLGAFGVAVRRRR